MKYSHGQLVICLKGKEKGRLMCVVGTDEKFVYLADGRERTFANPKKKNPKHVERYFSFTSADGQRTQKNIVK